MYPTGNLQELEREFLLIFISFALSFLRIIIHIKTRTYFLARALIFINLINLLLRLICLQRGNLLQAWQHQADANDGGNQRTDNHDEVRRIKTHANT